MIGTHGGKYSHARAAEQLPVLAYDPAEMLFYLADNMLAFAFVCQPLIGADDKTFNRLLTLLNENWSTGTFVQFVLYGSPDVQDQIKDMLDLRDGQEDPLMMATIEKRGEFLDLGTRQSVDGRSNVRVRDIRLYVVVKVPCRGVEPTTAELHDTGVLRLTVETSLQNIGFQPKAMTSDAYVHEMNVIVNQGPNALWRRGPIKADERALLRDQVFDFDSGVEVKSSGLMIGDTRVRVLCPKRYPKRQMFGAAATYLGDLIQGTRGIHNTFLMSATLYFPDATSAKDKIGAKKQVTVNQAYGPLLRFVPMIGEKLEDLEALSEAFEEGSKPVDIFFALVLFAASDEEATTAVSNAKNYLGEVGLQMLPDRYFVSPLFFNALPFGPEVEAMNDLKRYNPMSTAHVIPLLPIFGDWKGTGTPVFNLVSRNGQLMNMSLFDSGRNYNCCIVAESGSGKSFLTNEIISSELSLGGQAWVVDVGRSYEKYCRSVGGEFIHFGAGSDICLNPFQIVEDYAEEADVLAGLIVAMAAPNEALTNLQFTELRRTISELWDEYQRSMTIDHVAERLKKHTDQRVQDVGTQLWSFTSKGEYGKYFVGRNNVRFQNRFTVLELEELKGRKQLQTVVLLQLILQIQNNMYLGVRDRHKVVIIDEAWDLLTQGEVAKFIEHGYRRFRKYGGSAVVVTQGLAELYASDTGRAIVDNSTNMYLLGMKPAAVNAIQKEGRLSLGEGGYQLLKTIHTRKGVYSEVFCITDHGTGIGRLIVDKFRYLLYSTHPDDVQAIWRHQRQNPGMTVAEAINCVIEERGWQNAA